MSPEFKPPASLILVWEFRVHPGKQSEFEQAYGPDGNWAQLFRRSLGYIRTELHPDPNSPGRYFTLDFWQSKQAFGDFKHTQSDAYAALDAKCEPLTEEGTFIGECETAEQAYSLLLSAVLDINEKPTELHIRPATPADIPAILSLEQSAPSAAHWPAKTYEQIFNEAAASRFALLAEKTTGGLLGFAVARLSAGECELENIVVSAPERRKSVGRTLLHALVVAARIKGAASLFLEVRESNQAARALYEGYGFKVSGHRKYYYSSPSEDALEYTLSL